MVSSQRNCQHHTSKLPDNLHFGGAFRLLLLPLWIIPVQLIKKHHQSWDKVQVFVHPASLQNPFWNVPLIRCSLEGMEHINLNDLEWGSPTGSIGATSSSPPA